MSGEFCCLCLLRGDRDENCTVCQRSLCLVRGAWLWASVASSFRAFVARGFPQFGVLGDVCAGGFGGDLCDRGGSIVVDAAAGVMFG